MYRERNNLVKYSRARLEKKAKVNVRLNPSPETDVRRLLSIYYISHMQIIFLFRNDICPTLSLYFSETNHKSCRVYIMLTFYFLVFLSKSSAAKW